MKNKSSISIHKPKPLVGIYLRNVLKILLPKLFYHRYLGRHEEESLRLWRIFSKTVSNNGDILDIGAYKLEFSLRALSVNKNCNIHAFDPHPDFLNKDTDGVKLYNFALDNSNTLRRFKLDGAKSSIVEDDHDLMVECKKLDDICKDFKINPKLIKCDVEGNEPNIIEGGLNTIIKHKPIIICEVLVDKRGSQLEKLLSKTYDFYYINENKGIIKLKNIRRRNWKYRNWLFLPKDLTISYQLNFYNNYIRVKD